MSAEHTPIAADNLPEWREAVWQLARECPDVILMILTKRPQNLPRYLPADWGAGYPNVWVGTTVEHETEERRADALHEVPAALRFLSCEPLLGPVAPALSGIGWVICGGESGRNARPMHPDWARSLRDQCARAKVSFHFKQWGDFRPFLGWCDGVSGYADASGRYGADRIYRFPDGHYAVRCGKKNAGRLLDGVLHDDAPGNIDQIGGAV